MLATTRYTVAFAQVLVLDIKIAMNSSLCENASSAGGDYASCLLAEAEEPSYSICPDLTLCNSTQSGDNVGLGFALTIGAGLATTLGALFPLVPCIKRANMRFLVIGLGVAAGVMLYVNLAEIWNKSRDNFCCVTPKYFDIAVTACFFGGILITVLLDMMMTSLQKLECACCFPSRWRARSASCICCKECAHRDTITAINTSLNLGKISTSGHKSTGSNGLIFSGGSACVPTFPRADRGISGDGAPIAAANPSSNTVSRGLSLSNGAPAPNHKPSMIQLGEEKYREQVGSGEGDFLSHIGIELEEEKQPDNGVIKVSHTMSDDSSVALGPVEFKELTEGLGKSTKRLNRMGILTGVVVLNYTTMHALIIYNHYCIAMAIAIHNFPEGVATFVATLSSPALGVALAVAIGLHNIPEGLCVAMPIYYATGSRLKAFLWAFFSGVSEPFGELFIFL